MRSSSKYRILCLLEQAQETLSGGAIAKMLNVSRTAVWNHVRLLQSEGYHIESFSNRGYRLHKDNDVIQIDRLKTLCKENLAFEYHSVIGSTNTALKGIAHKCEEGCIMVAGEQTEGRGRRGRTFFSPGDSGIYMSILLKPRFSAEQASLLTALAALSVCRVLEQVLGIEPQIKWVNDIFYQDKKVCGILSEASYNVENAQLDYVVVGMGINVYPPKDSFPEELKSIAGVLRGTREYDLRNRVIAAIAEDFIAAYRALPQTDFIEDYKRRSMVLGKPIWVRREEEWHRALALDIDRQAHLLVEYENKERELLHSGEVSIRL